MNDGLLLSPLKLICLLFVYNYCVICVQHIDIDFVFLKGKYSEFEHETWHDICLIMIFLGYKVK